MLEMKEGHRAILREVLRGLDGEIAADELDAIAIFIISGLEGLSLERLDRGDSQALRRAREIFISLRDRRDRSGSHGLNPCWSFSQGGHAATCRGACTSASGAGSRARRCASSRGRGLTGQRGRDRGHGRRSARSARPSGPSSWRLCSGVGARPRALCRAGAARRRRRCARRSPSWRRTGVKSAARFPLSHIVFPPLMLWLASGCAGAFAASSSPVTATSSCASTSTCPSAKAERAAPGGDPGPRRWLDRRQPGRAGDPAAQSPRRAAAGSASTSTIG